MSEDKRQDGGGAEDKGIVNGGDVPVDIADEVNRKVNAAVSTHFRRGHVQNMIQDAVSASIEAALKDFTPPSPAPEASGQTATASTDDGQVAAFQARLKEMEGKLRQEQELRQEERTKAQTAQERGTLESALRASGVTDSRLRAATALLYTEDRRVGRDADGNIVFKVPRDGYTDELPMTEGVKEWLSTDEGKSFLPPTDASGSGSTKGRPPRVQGGKIDHEQALTNIFTKMLNHRG